MNSSSTLLLKKTRNKINLGLERIEAFLNYIGNPQDSFKSVIIGGTNGKGSTTFYLSNIACKATNLKIGRYISPHLIKVNERFVINEKEVENNRLNKVAKKINKELKTFEIKNKNLGKLTEFEVFTAIAFSLFKEEKVDLAFLEVGLGGRLDATNVVKNENVICSIITNISLDHTELLGKTVNEIAFEKSGIIKKNNTIITSAKDGLKIISNEAKRLNAKLIKVNVSNLSTYKEKNIKLTNIAWEIISRKLKIKKKINIYSNLKELQFNGRFQYLKNENILLDGAHNPGAAKELKTLINKQYKKRKKTYILGFLNKDYKRFINNLGLKYENIICTEPKSSRATKRTNILSFLRSKKINAEECISLEKSLARAKKKGYDLIIITGSLYLVGEALEILKSKREK